MKLHYWTGIEDANGRLPNFGDELNPYLWRRLLGDVFDDRDDVVFVGIGSLLNDALERQIPPDALKLIFGTGVGYGNRPLKLSDRHKVYCVRGPRSAEALGLGADAAVTDGAMLVRHLVPDLNRPRVHRYGYMPHWTNHTEDLKRLCGDCGLFYIDPARDDVEGVMDEILSCETLFTEAMHGAIIADTLRVPWVAIKSTAEVISFKWEDWCGSVGVPYAPMTVMPLWDRQGKGFSLKHQVKKMLVARQLRGLVATHKPMLSDAADAERLFDRLNERLDTLRRDIGA
jgi:succinoglycan biosynthesis protein ExoV